MHFYVDKAIRSDNHIYPGHIFMVACVDGEHACMNLRNDAETINNLRRLEFYPKNKDGTISNKKSRSSIWKIKFIDWEEDLSNYFFAGMNMHRPRYLTSIPLRFLKNIDDPKKEIFDNISRFKVLNANRDYLLHTGNIICIDPRTHQEIVILKMLRLLIVFRVFILQLVLRGQNQTLHHRWLFGLS